MTEHTPTPWMVQDSIIFACDDTLCRQPNHPENGKNWTADAAFIVKAVNSHDALVTALRDTLCELTACANQLAARGLPGREGDSVSRAQSAARTALSLQEGKSDG